MDPHLPSQNKISHALQPYSGWALDTAIQIDAQVPSFLATSFRWSALRRQVMFLIIDQISRTDTDFDLVEFAGQCGNDRPGISTNPLGRIGAALTTQRPQHVLRAILGAVPKGLIGALRRLGLEPATHPECYGTLLRIFASDDAVDRLRVRLIAQSTGPLKFGQIQALAVLDLVLLHPSVFARTRSIADAKTLNAAVAYLRARCRTATDQALRQSLDGIAVKLTVSHWLKRWAERFDRLPDRTSIFETDPSLHVLDSGPALIDAGRRFGNCLRSKVAEVMTGRYVFVEHRPDLDEPGAIAELRYTSKGYVLDGLYLKNNRTLPQDRAMALRARLACCGVAIRGHAPGNEEQLTATAKLLSIYDWRGRGGDMQWGNLEDELGE
ncbi:hypothetical protein MKK70_13410 [Methylobacterium sp. E-041]|uniref:hypothetical protein n=1 Tax=unclassified Methylobacterium TaxID=2615210 RepID=UPI001FBA2CCF|nr:MULTISPECIES: hypothetical protein [unclassified Methylobacterium]MCJ2038140.1 hypothetical protein [Methylobacterium sp. J-059]MCJ2106362.1 hypothetical protein [Methylobacterium sp. E-041]